jgi:hypothetical protein
MRHSADVSGLSHCNAAANLPASSETKEPHAYKISLPLVVLIYNTCPPQYLLVSWPLKESWAGVTETFWYACHKKRHVHASLPV